MRRGGSHCGALCLSSLFPFATIDVKQYLLQVNPLKARQGQLGEKASILFLYDALLNKENVEKWTKEQEEKHEPYEQLTQHEICINLLPKIDQNAWYTPDTKRVTRLAIEIRELKGMQQVHMSRKDWSQLVRCAAERGMQALMSEVYQEKTTQKFHKIDAGAAADKNSVRERAIQKVYRSSEEPQALAFIVAHVDSGIYGSVKQAEMRLQSFLVSLINFGSLNMKTTYSHVGRAPERGFLYVVGD